MQQNISIRTKGFLFKKTFLEGILFCYGDGASSIMPARNFLFVGVFQSNVIRCNRQVQVWMKKVITMILNKKIPKDFYKLFNTKNRDAYMQFLVSIYEENNEAYASLGLTMEECRVMIEDTITRARIIWEEEDDTEEGDQQEFQFPGDSPSGILNRLIKWGWLKSDFDEKLNTYVISFPEYSQLFAELFRKLQKEDDSRERESILSIYSALFTYASDPERNNDILKSALQTSKRLGQLLSNMQDGMRAYFDELSNRKNFIGIQEVLVEEINNSDSKKYAILTTTDSFYRYKEAVKDLISKILDENDWRKKELLRQGQVLEPDSIEKKRNQYSLEYCEAASQLVYQVEHEFDIIERKYNKLIEQKTIFAKRALARIHYILQEGCGEEDTVVRFIRLLDSSSKKEEMLEEMRDRLGFTAQFKNITENSFSSRRERAAGEFVPMVLEKNENKPEMEISEFVPKPLYTKKQLQSFRNKNMVDGTFITTEHTVQSVEDLEKLLFLWQEETFGQQEADTVAVEGEIQGKNGFTYSKLIITEENH